MGHFYFVRHGQTIWNVENKICGATDIALTEFGHQQAIETGRKILAEGIKADEILYSPLIRAADTARHISEITGILARVEPRLTEQRFGKWEATARNGEAFKKAKECFACSHEGGESTLHLAQGSIICWMRSNRNRTKKPIFLWHTMELREWCSPISTI